VEVFKINMYTEITDAVSWSGHGIHVTHFFPPRGLINNDTIKDTVKNVESLAASRGPIIPSRQIAVLGRTANQQPGKYRSANIRKVDAAPRDTATEKPIASSWLDAPTGPDQTEPCPVCCFPTWVTRAVKVGGTLSNLLVDQCGLIPLLLQRNGGAGKEGEGREEKERCEVEERGWRSVKWI